MSRFAYDTLGTSRELEAAGMERRQAEAVAIAIAQHQGNLATKSDLNSAIDSLRTEVKSDISKVESAISKVESDIDSLRTEVKSDISKVESDIREIKSDMKAQFRWLITMQIAVILTVIALLYENGP